ncbi:phosphatidylglycerophosphatase A [bacterium]|nr:phosphatidylglycerophosphatase A [bacterium]MBU1882352.1 phosphatidylglycerophosphatase A [bacterium]
MPFKDEFVGRWTALFFIVGGQTFLSDERTIRFLIFRALDIWKPFPANGSQKLPGGWGIMVDDLIVGLYTVAILHGVVWWLG